MSITVPQSLRPPFSRAPANEWYSINSIFKKVSSSSSTSPFGNSSICPTMFRGSGCHFWGEFPFPTYYFDAKLQIDRVLRCKKVARLTRTGASSRTTLSIPQTPTFPRLQLGTSRNPAAAEDLLQLAANNCNHNRNCNCIACKLDRCPIVDHLHNCIVAAS